VNTYISTCIEKSTGWSKKSAREIARGGARNLQYRKEERLTTFSLSIGHSLARLRVTASSPIEWTCLSWRGEEEVEFRQVPKLRICKMYGDGDEKKKRKTPADVGLYVYFFAVFTFLLLPGLFFFKGKLLFPPFLLM
jgi:hypothetical protein